MADVIVGKTADGHRLPVLVDSNGKIVLSGAFNSVGNVETSLTTISGNVATIASDLAAPLQMKVPGFQLPSYDYISMTYTSGNVTGVVYKTGGSTGTTVATLTLGYDGSGNVTSVTKT